MRNRSNDSNYHWDYQDYRGNYGQSPARARKSSGLKYFLIAMGVVILLVGALCIGASVWGSKPAPQPDQDSSIGNELEHLPEIDQQNKPEDNVPDTTEDGLLTPAGIYKKCAPSVVGIITYGSSSTAQGSGIILSENGYIITNAHVVSGGEKFEVVLQNGDSYDATVIGADNQSDLALLKMQNPPEGLVAATFGNSDELEVGEMVVAIGNPGGLALASTQTVGYISAVQRTITTELGYTMVCIQADAAINPGNSGGPLINTYGQVVGITSSKLVEEGYEGIGFSIPINTALPILDDLMQHGRVTGRAQLGITVVVITHQMSVVEEICDSVAILDGGVVVEQGEVREIFANPKTAAARRLVAPNGGSAARDLSSFAPDDHVVRVTFNGSSAAKPLVASLAAEKGILVSVLSADTRDLSGQCYGSMLLKLPRDTEQAKQAAAYMRSQNGVTVEEVTGE